MRASNKAKASWNIINSYRNVANSGNEIRSSPDSINKSFVTAAGDLMRSVPKTDIHPIELMPKREYSGFSFQTVSISDVRRTILDLKNSKSVDIYGLSTALIKQCREPLLYPLKCLLNSSITSGIFPDLLKAAAVVPIPKKNGNDLRPISILPIISKVFEKILFDQILRYFGTNQILSSAQFGFRKGLGTHDAIASLIEEIMVAFDASEFAVLSAYDLSKAFDCMNSDILVSKLQHYKFDNLSCNLIASYFKGRTQAVRVGSKCSEPLLLESGAAQGSILGPLLFIIFVNDLPDFLKGVMTAFYADDSNSINRSRHLDDAIERANYTTTKFEEWFSNGFSLNREKTMRLILTLRKCEINRDIESVNILGLNIDNKLTWKVHGDQLAVKLCRSVFLIRRLANIVDINVLRTAYFAVFHSALTYCNIIWGHSAISNRLFAIQRRAVRVLGGIGYRDDCRSTYINLKIMTVPSLFIYNCLLHTRKHIERFTTNGTLYDYNTRSRDKIRVDRNRVYKSRHGGNYWGPTFFNVIPKSVAQLPEEKFRDCVKKFVLENAFYNWREFFAAASAWCQCA